MRKDSSTYRLSRPGRWAFSLALLASMLVGLVLMEPALYAAFPAGSRPPGVAAMIETVAPLFSAGRLHEAMMQFSGILAPERSSEALNKTANDRLASDSRAGWEALAREMSPVGTWGPTPAEWSRITQPALVLEGDCTGEVLRAVAARVSELLPNGELVTLEGLDHMAPWSAPDVVAQKTVEFIDRVAALESEDDSTM